MKKYEWDEDDEYYADEDIIKYIKEILKGNKGFMCQYDRSLNFETVWSSIFFRSEGNPRRCRFIKDERLKR